MPTDHGRLRDAWTSIVRWCEENAPRTARSLQGPISADELASLQSRISAAVPGELASWLQLNNGTDRSASGDIIPRLFTPLSGQQIVEEWTLMTQLGVELVDEAERVEFATAPAGTRAWAFLTSWIPFASDFGGDLLFVDMRAGPSSGCVCRWEEDDAFVRDPLWDNLTDMIVAIDHALWAPPGDPRRSLRGDVPVASDGVLRWVAAKPPGRNLEAPAPSDIEAHVLIAHGSHWPVQQIAERLGIPEEMVTEILRKRGKTPRTEWS